MATENFIVTSLPEYVENNKEVLVNKFGLLGNATRQRISIQTGVKGKAALNYLDINPVLQDGAECAFTPEGTAELTQREIETAIIKVDMEFCPRKLRGKYAEYLIRINALEEGNKLPFEEYVVDLILDSINDRIETMMWQGDTAKTGDNTKKWIDGFLKIAKAEDGVIDVAIASSKTAYEAILDVYMAMPEGILDMNPEIYVSPAIFRKFVQEMVAKNWYQISVGTPQDEFVLPGTDVKVVKTKGLAGTQNIVGTFPKNLYYATDMEGDEEALDLWYSKDDRVFKLEALWNSGVQIAYPDMVVLGEVAA
jgi:hypothetical protein